MEHLVAAALEFEEASRGVGVGDGGGGDDGARAAGAASPAGPPSPPSSPAPDGVDDERSGGLEEEEDRGAGAPPRDDRDVGRRDREGSPRTEPSDDSAAFGDPSLFPTSAVGADGAMPAGGAYSSSWQSTFRQLKDFHDLGHRRYPPRMVRWMDAQRRAYKRYGIGIEEPRGIMVHRIRQLNSMGFEWEVADEGEEVPAGAVNCKGSPAPRVVLPPTAESSPKRRGARRRLVTSGNDNDDDTQSLLSAIRRSGRARGRPWTTEEDDRSEGGDDGSFDSRRVGPRGSAKGASTPGYFSKPRVTFRCPSCPKEFQWQPQNAAASLQNHMRKTHNRKLSPGTLARLLNGGSASCLPAAVEDTYDVAAGANRRKKLFPETLFEMVNECSRTEPHVVDWIEDGTAFQVKDVDLVPRVLTKYFRHDKYRSLARMLYLYGFRAVRDKPGAFSHPCFTKWSAPEELRRVDNKGGTSEAAAPVGREGPSRSGVQSLHQKVRRRSSSDETGGPRRQARQPVSPGETSVWRGGLPSPGVAHPDLLFDGPTSDWNLGKHADNPAVRYFRSDVGDGWAEQIVPRMKVDAASGRAADKYFLGPGGERFRSRTEVDRFLEKEDEGGSEEGDDEDLGSAEEEEEDPELNPDDESGDEEGSGAKKSFPESLHDLVSFADAEDPSVVRWEPDGRVFSVIGTGRDRLGPYLLRYFSHANWTSLQRQLYNYGFTSVGPTKGSYAHPNFRRASRREELRAISSNLASGKKRPATSKAHGQRAKKIPRLAAKAGKTTTGGGKSNKGATPGYFSKSRVTFRCPSCSKEFQWLPQNAAASLQNHMRKTHNRKLEPETLARLLDGGSARLPAAAEVDEAEVDDGAETAEDADDVAPEAEDERGAVREEEAEEEGASNKAKGAKAGYFSKSRVTFRCPSCPKEFQWLPQNAAASLQNHMRKTHDRKLSAGTLARLLDGGSACLPAAAEDADEVAAAGVVARAAPEAEDGQGAVREEEEAEEAKGATSGYFSKSRVTFRCPSCSKEFQWQPQNAAASLQNHMKKTHNRKLSPGTLARLLDGGSSCLPAAAEDADDVAAAGVVAHVAPEAEDEQSAVKKPCAPATASSAEQPAPKPDASKKPASAPAAAKKQAPVSATSSSSPQKTHDAVEPHDDDILLSLRNPRYKQIMFAKFKTLGKRQGGGENDDLNELKTEMFSFFKKRMGKDGRFLKLVDRHGTDVQVVDDKEAIEKIRMDLRRRNESSQHWFKED